MGFGLEAWRGGGGGGMAWHEACPSPAVQACPLRYFSATYFCSAPLNMISTSLSVCLFSFELCFTRKDKSRRQHAVQGFTSLFHASWWSRSASMPSRACPEPTGICLCQPTPGIFTNSWHINRFSAYLLGTSDFVVIHTSFTQKIMLREVYVYQSGWILEGGNFLRNIFVAEFPIFCGYM